MEVFFSPVLFFSFAIILIALDLLLLNVIFPLVIGLSFLVTGIVSLISSEPIFILSTLLVSFVILYFSIVPLLKKLYSKDTLKESNVYSYLDKEAVVIKPITLSQKGYILIKNEEWLASSSSNIDIDEVVIIKSIDGGTFIVEKKFI